MMYMFAIEGVSGQTIKLDKHGDSEGNFSVLALKKEHFHFVASLNSLPVNFSCEYQMKPVGLFQQGEALVSELSKYYRARVHLFI